MFICRFDNARDSVVLDFVNHNLVGKKILELGCGNGDRTKLFYGLSQVTGVDIVDKVSSERKRKFDFFLADATALPFGDESFDAIVSFDVVEHIQADKQFVHESFRVCKKGGFVVLGTPNRLRLSNRLMRLIGKPVSYPYYLGPDTIHLREYTAKQFDSLCKASGLIGNCLSIWIGLVGRIDLGLAIFPPSTASLVQYLLFVGYKPDKCEA
jgi:ubiquinone/menaquinone biosynthesis C-methylase UbiE